MSQAYEVHCISSQATHSWGHAVQTTVTTKHPTSLANSISDQSTSVDSLSMNVGRVANPVTKPGIGESEEVTW